MSDKIIMMNGNNNPPRKYVYGFTTSPEQKDTQPHQLSYKYLWSGFKERTTAHGVSPIADAKGMFVFVILKHPSNLEFVMTAPPAFFM